MTFTNPDGGTEIGIDKTYQCPLLASENIKAPGIVNSE